MFLGPHKMKMRNYFSVFDSFWNFLTTHPLFGPGPKFPCAHSPFFCLFLPHPLSQMQVMSVPKLYGRIFQAPCNILYQATLSMWCIHYKLFPFFRINSGCPENTFLLYLHSTVNRWPAYIYTIGFYSWLWICYSYQVIAGHFTDIHVKDHLVLIAYTGGHHFRINGPIFHDLLNKHVWAWCFYVNKSTW